MEWSKRKIGRLYRRLEPKIMKAAVAFTRQHGGTVEELMSEARPAFMEAVRSHNPDPSTWKRKHTTYKAIPIESWVRRKIWKVWKSMARSIARHNRILKRNHIDMILLPGKRSFVLSEFFEALSSDAIMVVKLVIDPDLDVRMLATQGKGIEHVNTLRDAVVETLRDKGWTEKKLAKVFCEISNAISEV